MFHTSNSFSINRKHPKQLCLLSVQLFVFHLIWSFSVITSLEIWSVYFDETLELIKTKNNLIIQQIINVPFDDERYIIEIQTFIDSIENRDRIRRMELNLCEEIINDEDSLYNSFYNQSLFYDSNGSNFLCLQRIASIQMPNIDNHTIVQYPDNVGLPFNKYKSDHTIRSLLLTIEYLNDFDSFHDHSGFDLYLLDPKEISIKAGIMAIGFVPDFRFFLPPKLNHWSLKGICMGSCLQNRVTEGIKIVSTIVNTNHRYLEQLTVQIVKARGEKMEIFSYGPSHGGFPKSMEFINEPMVNIRDKIIVECNYFTSNKTIRGGFGEDDENCIVWLHYYPKIELDACLSSYSLATIMSLLDLDDINVTITRAKGFDLKINEQDKLSSFLNEKDVTEQWNVDKLIRAKYSATKGKQIPQCGWNPMQIELRRRKRQTKVDEIG